MGASQIHSMAQNQETGTSDMGVPLLSKSGKMEKWIELASHTFRSLEILNKNNINSPTWSMQQEMTFPKTSKIKNQKPSQ